MICIDSDTDFTPLDAFADLDPKYAGQGPRLVELPSGHYRVDYPARAPFVLEHIKPLRVNGRPKGNFEIEPRLDAMAQDGFDMQVSTAAHCSASNVLRATNLDVCLGFPIEVFTASPRLSLAACSIAFRH